ncbi:MULTISPECIES: DUF2599 domain-containing protein [Pseudomonas]|jgi:hypothetical protein|uniref:DUF2599 domain-containing protein n=1 Tax=Pseudomonas TaxID=286 RepID=UPI001AEB5910|nr:MULTISPECIES: DUF2599 domain-containing protein [unclassified Pseudomonas]MBP1127947.1 hypothetical protein [Pseudomonas sp. PvP025]MDQ0396885.1 hypothetical protein [Pseudomonas sp. PvP006]
MKHLLNLPVIVCVLCFGSSAHAKYLTHDETGAATASEIVAAYNNTAVDCGSEKRPSILCSGVTIRGTIYSSAFRFWNPGPASKEATSFSWLRKDAKFRQLASDHRHGYLMRPIVTAPDDYIQLQVLCAFPMDAGTHMRAQAGCGDFIKTAEIERSCQELGITTAAAWRDDYMLNKRSKHRQCGFDLRPATEPAGANAFMQFVKAHAFEEVLSEHFAAILFSNNEVRIASWPQSDGSRLPIWALFWISNNTVTGAASDAGKVDAQRDQIALYEDSGHFLPIIRMTLPMTPAQEATFSYNPADQARLDTVLCRRFIDKAQWVNRYDPGAKADRWTLQLTPTDCGRLSQANQLDKFYAEVVAKYGRDNQWLAENKGGVRRQLACLLTTYRNNTTYNLEPFRPNVSHEAAVAAQCNPV